MPGLGTVLNVVAIAVGASIGTLLGGRLPERLGDDLSGAVGRSAPLLVLGVLLAGGLVACVGPLAVLGAFVLSRLGRGRLGAWPCSSTRAA
jgi:uncharacterized membrane protein YqgA involved in biofilm formation